MLMVLYTVGGSVYAIKKNTDALLDASKENE